MAKSATHEIEECFKGLKNDPEFAKNALREIACLQKSADDMVHAWNRKKRELGITDEHLYGNDPAPVKQQDPLKPPKLRIRTYRDESGTDFTIVDGEGLNSDFYPGEDF